MDKWLFLDGYYQRCNLSSKSPSQLCGAQNRARWLHRTARAERRAVRTERRPSDRGAGERIHDLYHVITRGLGDEQQSIWFDRNWDIEAEAMASRALMISSTAAVGSTTKTNTKQSNAISAFDGLRLPVQFPSNANAKAQWDSKTSTNGSRVQCMQVWPPYNNKKFETLSYLPPLKPEQLLREIDYLLRNGWIPCLEFDENGYIFRDYHRSPGCYNGRYWIMWKLPMFGCQDSAQVVAEVEECKKAYPKAFIRIIGFDNKRQVQCISFVVHRPE